MGCSSFTGTDWTEETKNPTRFNSKRDIINSGYIFVIFNKVFGNEHKVRQIISSNIRHSPDLLKYSCLDELKDSATTEIVNSNETNIFINSAIFCNK